VSTPRDAFDVLSKVAGTIGHFRFWLPEFPAPLPSMANREVRIGGGANDSFTIDIDGVASLVRDKTSRAPDSALLPIAAMVLDGVVSIQVRQCGARGQEPLRADRALLSLFLSGTARFLGSTQRSLDPVHACSLRRGRQERRAHRASVRPPGSH
jgi:hypothetical protein